jgi:hypothetical protein
MDAERLLEALLFAYENMKAFNIPALSENNISGVYSGRLILCFANGQQFEITAEEL